MANNHTIWNELVSPVGVTEDSLRAGPAGRGLVVGFVLHPAAGVAPQHESPALVVDEDEDREGNGRQPPDEPAGEEDVSEGSR